MKSKSVNGTKRQRGAAGIEFALLFILFFTFFYAIVSYSLAMLLSQGLTQAAEEGVRAAIVVDPLAFRDEGSYVDRVDTVVLDRVTVALSWMPSKAKRLVLDSGNIQTILTTNAGVKTVTVTVTYPGYASNGLIPTLRLPGIGAVPRLPTNLVGMASLQL